MRLWRCSGQILKRRRLTKRARGFVLAAGAANGHFSLGAVMQDALQQGAEAAGVTAASQPLPEIDQTAEAAMEAVWMMPQGAGIKLRSKAWLDFQNDVKVSDVQLAAQEGFESVEHAKRYTTLGMATDQGEIVEY